MINRITYSLWWHINRLSKNVYFGIRILLYPYKKIAGISIPLQQNWAFTIKDHILKADYETGELKIISNTLVANDIVLEIGTGLGFLATFCAQRVGAANVTSIEANPFLEVYHQKIFRLNSITPKVLYKAIGNLDGEMDFYIDRKKFWSSSLKPFKSKFLQKIKVSTLNINHIIETVNPTYLIIDVEGFECEMIEMVTDFKAIRKIQMEVHPEVIGKVNLVKMKLNLLQRGFNINNALSDERQYYFEAN